jgi:PAS domain S-box-containing protein
VWAVERVTTVLAPPRTGLVVIIEDSPSDQTMIRAMLANGNSRASTSMCANSLAEGLRLIDREHPSCVLLDLGLPDSDGLATVDAVVEHVPAMPVVILTGYDDDYAGQQAVAHGAQDYLVKGKIDAQLLLRTVRYATERKAAGLTVRLLDSRVHALLDVALDALIGCSPQGVITFWNRGAVTTYGWSEQEALGQRMDDLLSFADRGLLPGFPDIVNAQHWEGDAIHRTKDGRAIVVEGRWSTLLDDLNKPLELFGANRDVTARCAMQGAELDELMGIDPG